MGKSKAPRPADPRETAAAQTATNIATAIAQQNLNNVNQVTPYGTLTYTKSGEYEYVDPLRGKTYKIPQYTAHQVLSSQQNEILNHNNAAGLNLAMLASEQSGNLRNFFQNSFSPNVSSLPQPGSLEDLSNIELQAIENRPQLKSQLANVGGVQSSISAAGDIRGSYGGDFGEQRQRVEDALLARLNPQLARDRESLEVRLANQGIRLGSQAYADAQADFGRKTNDARLAAILAAGGEQSRLAGLAQQQAQFENSAQSQRFNQNERRGNFANSAQQQAFSQGAATVDFANDVLADDYHRYVKEVGLRNEQKLLARQLELEKFDALAAARNQRLNEQFALRNQPINEITALLSGSQIENPNFINPQVSKIANTDFISAQNNYEKLRQAQYSNGIESLLGVGKLFF